jgi:hypothetical protein
MPGAYPAASAPRTGHGEKLLFVVPVAKHRGPTTSPGRALRCDYRVTRRRIRLTEGSSQLAAQVRGPRSSWRRGRRSQIRTCDGVDYSEVWRSPRSKSASCRQSDPGAGGHAVPLEEPRTARSTGFLSSTPPHRGVRDWRARSPSGSPLTTVQAKDLPKGRFSAYPHHPVCLQVHVNRLLWI